MRRNDSVGAALVTLALLVSGALVALLVAVTLRGCGWDVSGEDALLKGGVAFGSFLALVLLGSAAYRIRTWLCVRRVGFLRVMNARIRGVVFDDAEYADYRDMPRFWRRVVRWEMRHPDGLSDKVTHYAGGPASWS